MNFLKIECEDVNIEAKGNDVVLYMRKPDMQFVGDIPVKDLVSGFDNEELFKAIIENDEELLHNYLTECGYVFNKM